MKTDLHLIFPGTCREAFAFYAQVFSTQIIMTWTFGDAPAGSPVPPASKGLIMHTSMQLGSILLMGCDDPAPEPAKMGGFQISLSVDTAAEVHRLFETLSPGGSVTMPPQQTFWAPLFSMFTDRFGVGWMIGIPGKQIIR